ncbi:MAG: TatD family hydrolase [Acidimicrobiales bacterium]
MWTDSHCHVQWDEDPPAVLERAAAAGVGRAVLVGTDDETSRRAVAVAQAVAGVAETGAWRAPAPELWATVGLHPHDAKTGLAATMAHLRELVGGQGLETSRVVAIGECGLDYHYDHSPRPEQREVFAAQIAVAHEHSLALVIHTRSAWDDTFAILDREGVPPRTILHCFTGGPEEAAECLARGAYVSFSGIVTFPKAFEVHAAATACPLGSLLVETDSPFLAPVPMRGKTNEPSLLPYVGQQIAALKGLQVASVEMATSANAAAAFGLPD